MERFRSRLISTLLCRRCAQRKMLKTAEEIDMSCGRRNSVRRKRKRGRFSASCSKDMLPASCFNWAYLIPSASASFNSMLISFCTASSCILRQELAFVNAEKLKVLEDKFAKLTFLLFFFFF